MVVNRRAAEQRWNRSKLTVRVSVRKNHKRSASFQRSIYLVTHSLEALLESLFALVDAVKARN
jgi:hypothetical protein